MTSAPETAPFPYKKRVQSSHVHWEDKLFGDSPPRGLFTSKIGFDAELIREHPPAACLSEYAPPWLNRAELESHRRVLNPLARWAFDLTQLDERTALGHPILWSENATVSVLFLGERQRTPRIRHAEASTLLFVHKGKGTIITDFGKLPFAKGDFLFLPCGATWQVRTYQKSFFLLYEFPQQLLQASYPGIPGYPFGESALLIPEPLETFFLDPQDQSDATGDRWAVCVKHYDGSCTRLWYPFSPFDTVAWEGTNYPCVLHLADIRAIESPNFHLDPSARTLFLTQDKTASVQVFLPRRVQSPPYYHLNNVHEVLFNHEGYGARPAIKDGWATLHPKGIYHGPDMGTVLTHQRAAIKPEELPWRNETAVLLESDAPFIPLKAARAITQKDYDLSWFLQYREQEIEKQKARS